VVADIPNITLNPGTYWVEYSATVTATNVFAPAVEVGIGGNTLIPFGNAISGAGTAWSALTDFNTASGTGYLSSNWSSVGGFPYGVPFIVEGSVSCSCPGDMNLNRSHDGDDIQAFVNCLLAAGTGCSCADVDGSGTVDAADVDPF